MSYEIDFIFTSHYILLYLSADEILCLKNRNRKQILLE